MILSRETRIFHWYHVVSAVDSGIMAILVRLANANSAMSGFVTEQSYINSLQNNMMEAAEVINYVNPNGLLSRIVE